MKYLGVPFEHHKLVEWAVPSIQAYKDLHFGTDKTEYSATMAFDEVVDYLYRKGISANYNEPMTLQSIRRMGEKKCRAVYNNIQATHNLVNIQQVHGVDLEITDTDKYCYIMTYSFPCQDLSNAGLGAGMAKGSGTRSGMLWEVERILRELNGRKQHLPQVMVMENVPEVHGQNNIQHFAEWVAFLESIGFKCYWEDLNARDYGIPQNRNRCFMVSVLGDYLYEFPQTMPLEHLLADCLEQEVDEKYYLSDATIDTYLEYNKRNEEKGNGFKFEPTTEGQFNSQSNTDKGGKPSVRQLCGAVISQQGRRIDRLTDTATTLMARDYKGFGNQGQTGVIECQTDTLPKKN